jgi:hypothetical protein
VFARMAEREAAVPPMFKVEVLVVRSAEPAASE